MITVLSCLLGGMFLTGWCVGVATARPMLRKIAGRRHADRFQVRYSKQGRGPDGNYHWGIWDVNSGDWWEPELWKMRKYAELNADILNREHKRGTLVETS